MPKVHQYVDGRGFYIKSAIKGRIITYQVSPKGVQYFKQRGYKNGSNLSLKELQKLIKRGYVFSGGSGPGIIEEKPLETIHQKQKTSTRDTAFINTIGVFFIVSCCCLLGINFLLNRETGEQIDVTETVQELDSIQDAPTSTFQIDPTDVERANTTPEITRLLLTPTIELFPTPTVNDGHTISRPPSPEPSPTPKRLRVPQLEWQVTEIDLGETVGAVEPLHVTIHGVVKNVGDTLAYNLSARVDLYDGNGNFLETRNETVTIPSLYFVLPGDERPFTIRSVASVGLFSRTNVSSWRITSIISDLPTELHLAYSMHNLYDCQFDEVLENGVLESANIKAFIPLSELPKDFVWVAAEYKLLNVDGVVLYMYTSVPREAVAFGGARVVTSMDSLNIEVSWQNPGLSLIDGWQVMSGEVKSCTARIYTKDNGMLRQIKE